MAPQRSALSTLAIALVTVLTGCSSGPPPQPSPQASLSVTVVQHRRDVAKRVVALQTTNTGTEPVVVERVLLMSSSFHANVPTDKDSRLMPGIPVDLTVKLGHAVCGTGSAEEAPETPSSVRFWLNGSNNPVTVPVTETDVLTIIRDRECAERELRQLVDVAFGKEFARVGAGESLVVQGAVLVGPVNDDHTVEVTAINGTTIFSIEPSGLPITVSGSNVITVPVALTPSRCDPHAMADSSMPYAFTMQLSVDGGPAQALVISPPEARQPMLNDVWREQCGFVQPEN